MVVLSSGFSNIVRRKLRTIRICVRQVCERSFAKIRTSGLKTRDASLALKVADRKEGRNDGCWKEEKSYFWVPPNPPQRTNLDAVPPTTGVILKTKQKKEKTHKTTNLRKRGKMWPDVGNPPPGGWCCFRPRAVAGVDLQYQDQRYAGTIPSQHRQGLSVGSMLLYFPY
uniref:rRNA-processing protein cgrA n=1 Tax=Lygus hesperus TaxID=30085 RepID=A0A0A9X7V8_LYGHE